MGEFRPVEEPGISVLFCILVESVYLCHLHHNGLIPYWNQDQTE